VFRPVARFLITSIAEVLIKELLTVFFPHLAHVCIDQVFRSGASLRIKARTTTSEAECPSCGTQSRQNDFSDADQPSDLLLPQSGDKPREQGAGGYEGTNIFYLVVFKFYSPDLQKVNHKSISNGRNPQTLHYFSGAMHFHEILA
jgi:hypothetical protein